jgi:hypothetical protein
MKLNSVIFHTTRFKEMRDFYEGVLSFSIGTFEKDGESVPDFSDSYVNYDLDGTLLCFEYDQKRTDLGTIVINVVDFKEFREKLEHAGVAILTGNDSYFKIKDPEGRSIIIEP